MHGTHAGTVADADEFGAAVEGTDCDGRAWYALNPSVEPSFFVSWTAPDCSEGSEVTIYATAAEKSIDSYRQAQVCA